MNESFILQTNRISKRFRRAVAVDEVSLAVREGTVYGLLGPNGAGKTTLLNTLYELVKF